LFHIRFVPVVDKYSSKFPRLLKSQIRRGGAGVWGG